MGYKVVRNLSGMDTNRKLLYLDTDKDLPDLSDLNFQYLSVGSEAVVIGENKHFVLNTKKEWVRVPWGVDGIGTMGSDFTDIDPTTPTDTTYVRGYDINGNPCWIAEHVQVAATESSLPTMGNLDTLYFIEDTGKLKYWNGSEYDDVIAGNDMFVQQPSSATMLPSTGILYYHTDTKKLYRYDAATGTHLPVFDGVNFQIVRDDWPVVGDVNTLYYDVLNSQFKLWDSTNEVYVVSSESNVDNFQPVLSTSSLIKNQNILYYFTDLNQFVRYNPSTSSFEVIEVVATNSDIQLVVDGIMPTTANYNTLAIDVETGDIYNYTPDDEWVIINSADVPGFIATDSSTLPASGNPNTLYYLTDKKVLERFNTENGLWQEINLDILEDAPSTTEGKVYARMTTSLGINEWVVLPGTLEDAPTDVANVLYVRKTNSSHENSWVKFSTEDLINDAPSTTVGNQYVRETTAVGENEWRLISGTLTDAPTDVEGRQYVRKTTVVGTNTWVAFDCDGLEDAPTDISEARYIRKTNDHGVNEWERLLDSLEDAPTKVAGKLYVRKTTAVGTNEWVEYSDLGTNIGIEEAPKTEADVMYVRYTNAMGENSWKRLTDAADDAPSTEEGAMYVRLTESVGKNVWAKLPDDTFTDAPVSVAGKSYVRTTQANGINTWTELDTGMEDAPTDVLNKQYVRKTTSLGTNVWAELDTSGTLADLDGTATSGKLYARTIDPATGVKSWVALTNGMADAPSDIEGKHYVRTTTSVGTNEWTELDAAFDGNVVIANTFSLLPSVGESGKVYITLSDGGIYKWNEARLEYKLINGSTTETNLIVANNFTELVEIPDKNVQKIYVSLEDNAIYKWTGVEYIQIGGGTSGSSSQFEVQATKADFTVPYVEKKIYYALDTGIAYSYNKSSNALVVINIFPQKTQEQYNVETEHASYTVITNSVFDFR